MFIKQLSVFVENSQGRLQQIIDVLGENHINIRALSLADTAEFGILRLIVDEHERASALLREKGVISKVTEVIAVSIDDCAGGLAAVTRAITDADIGIEYTYAFLGRSEGKALLVIQTNDEKRAESILREKGVALVSEEDLR